MDKRNDEVVFDNTPFAERLANMRNFRTSRSKVKYYHDINVETKKWEVIELPSRRIIKVHNFEEDAEKHTVFLNKINRLETLGFQIS